MHHLFEMAHLGQHRQDGLNQHPIVPLAAAAQLQVGWIAGFGMEAGIPQDHTVMPKEVNHGMKPGVVGIRRCPNPADDAPTWLMIRHSLPPTIQRRFEMPLRPICWGLRPSRMG